MDQINSGSVYNSLNSSVLRQQTSMSTLISWNIAKAIEANPSINLKTAIKATHERLETDTSDVMTVLSQNPEDQYLACALLAWQQLGHNEAESLYEFVEKKRDQSRQQDNNTRPEEEPKPRKPMLSPGSFISYEDSTLSRGVGSSNYDSYSLVGPVVKLPVETKIVMRLDNTPNQRQQRRKSNEKDLMNKIDAACCMESACIEKLSQLDRSTAEMRVRAERLARREAERVELLERAEAAWKDLELGYQRRLAMAEEKEEDMAKHIKKLIEERNGYKNACTTLAQTLRERGEVAEKERAKLTQEEKEMCETACMRLRVSEEAAKLDAALAEQQCKATQFERDLQFKEEQIRRKLQAMDSSLESTRCLTHETERALHGELSALRAQVTKVSHQLLEQDAENVQLKEQLELLRQEKMGMVEDLDGCKVLCDGRIQGKMDALKKKKEQLNELRERVMECQCKMPVDASVEAKRTPSLAALCKCSPEDKYLDSCSCTSLRSSLLSNLLADLFGGLQDELGGCGPQMPCQLLKCLEDRHNWDKSSVVKTNLRKYFSQLLIGELDIAIATSIEKYHAKWVGASCADVARMIPDRGGPEVEGWQERALERRAQKLAAQLAEQLFQERADQLTAKAKEVIRTGPPPCECKPGPTAVYSVLVKQPGISRHAPTPADNGGAATSAYWHQTHQDVTQLKVQLDDLKKDAIKKEDLKVMEENIVKLVQRATVTEDTNIEPVDESLRRENDKKANSIHRSVNTVPCKNNVGPKLSSIKKKQTDLSSKTDTKNFLLGLQIDKPVRSFKTVGRSYAVNMCLCSSRKDSKKKSRASAVNEVKKPLKGVPNIISPISSIKQTKPTACKPSQGVGIVKQSKTGHLSCRSGIICFHKPPSNTSIDKLLETLAKWKCDLSQLDNKNVAVASDHGIKSTYQTIPSKISQKLSALPYRSNVIVANVSTSVPGGLQINTESEYMGTINLESRSANREQAEDNIFKCIQSESSKDPVDGNNQCDQTHNMVHKNLTLATVKNNVPASENKPKINEPNIVQKENTPDLGVGLITQPSSFANDCQYCIKFLGVTLTNANSKKIIPEMDPGHKNERRVIVDTNHRRKNNHPQVWYNNVHNPCLHKPNVPVCVPNTQVYMPASHCSTKHDEVKNIPKVFSVKHHGDFNKNQDKSMDTQSLKIVPESECCVCCGDKLDESQDLEVNAFHLLEEHLREKMEEFKAADCKSTYITPEEEERLFSNILNRVKQIITDNTGSITCKCDPKEPVEGSWNRAYMLLEEYLKIKIKKVHCLCLSKKESNKQILPDILEKVCMLIDDDFKRLKKMCKSKSAETADNNFVYATEFPEKDSHDFTYNNDVKENYTSNELKEVDKISKEISNNSILKTQNTSSQMSPIHDVDTKSCEAMEIKTQNKHTSHIFANKCCKVADISYDHDFCTHSTKITKSFNTLFGSNDLTMNQYANIHDDKECFLPVVNIEPEQGQGHDSDPKEKQPNFFLNDLNYKIDNKDKLSIEADKHQELTNMQKKTPYIGYTIDCSCDRALGTCSCTKSLIKGKGDNINSIWNTLTSNKLRHYDISYIMDGVVNRKLTAMEKNSDELNKTDNMQPVIKSTCDFKTGAQYCDEIVLKDSNDRLNKHFLSNTTSVEDIIFSPDECSNSAKHKTLIMTDFSENTCEGSFHYPVRNIINHGKNTGLIKSDPIHQPKSFSSECDCNMVPMCHVKMLVENIENKLIHSKCTCDSLCSKVCPVHSKKNLL